MVHPGSNIHEFEQEKKQPVNIYTREQVDKIRQIYESSGWDTNIIDNACIDANTYDRDKIDQDYKKQKAGYIDADFTIKDNLVQETEEPKTGFCKCGCNALPEDLYKKYAASFEGTFNYKLPADICEKCACDLWSNLMEKKKTSKGGA